MKKAIIIAALVAVATPALARDFNAGQIRALENRIRQLERGTRFQPRNTASASDVSLLAGRIDILTRRNLALQNQVLELLERIKKLEAARHSH